MPIRRSLVAAATLLLAAVLVGESRAEVAVETDAYGNYVRTTIFTQATIRQPKIWRVIRRHVWGSYPLNPEGDRRGDQFPTVAENPVDQRHPWAVWSRFNGWDYDLVWSTWRRPGGWAPVRWLGADAPQVGDDLAPHVVFDNAGRPYLVWWRDEGGVGRVYLSFYLVTRWMTPFAVSDEGVDSRSPRVAVDSAGEIRVEYQTGSGPEARVVSFAEPTTITDDLNPVNQMNVERVHQTSSPGNPANAAGFP